MVVEDTPRFAWRGLMLDPARHFITVQQLNASIDAMAQNKLNTLHLHLTDGESFTPNSEGWPTFPLLSAKGVRSSGLNQKLHTRKGCSWVLRLLA
jgi:hexosaminidase